MHRWGRHAGQGKLPGEEVSVQSGAACQEPGAPPGVPRAGMWKPHLHRLCAVHKWGLWGWGEAQRRDPSQ